MKVDQIREAMLAALAANAVLIRWTVDDEHPEGAYVFEGAVFDVDVAVAHLLANPSATPAELIVSDGPWWH